MAAVGDVDVPRVPLRGRVAVQVQDAGPRSRRHGLATAREVDDRGEASVGVDAGAHDAVVEHDAVALASRQRAFRGEGRADCERLDTATRLRSRVREHACPAARADERAQALRDDLLELGGDRGVVALRVAVHPGDRAAREDVVELLEQHELPEPPQPLLRIRRSPPHRRGRGPQLGLAQEVLAAAVALLRAQLARVGAPVELEVELALPHLGVGVFRLRGAEEVARCRVHDARRGLERPGAGDDLRHLARRAAAAVAVAVGEQRHRRAALVGEVALGVREVGGRDVGVVLVDGGEVREDACAVEALPRERVVGHAVRLVPRDLLRQEPAGARLPDDLGESGRVAERVGQPHLRGVDAELLEEEALARDELTGEGLAAGHVGV